MAGGSQGYSGSDDYIASKALMEIVNVAVVLKKPLVVKGEPGTGKTLLAHSIARALNKKLLIWNIKSTTKARDGLYVYDTVQRLNDARFKDKDISDIRQYIKMGKLGRRSRVTNRSSSSSMRSTRPISSFPTTCSTSLTR
jgi:MoxR-like ATPase